MPIRGYGWDMDARIDAIEGAPLGICAKGSSRCRAVRRPALALFEPVEKRDTLVGGHLPP
jgi:hypothetical protein